MNSKPGLGADESEERREDREDESRKGGEGRNETLTGLTEAKTKVWYRMVRGGDRK